MVAVLALLASAPAARADYVTTLETVPVAGGPVTRIATDREAPNGISSVRWAPDGETLLATAGPDQAIRRFPGGRVVREVLTGFDVLLGPGGAVYAEYRDAGLRFGRGGVVIRDTASNRVLARAAQRKTGDDYYEDLPLVTFSPDATKAVVVRTMRLQVLDLRTGRRVGPAGPPAADAAFSPDGTQLALAGVGRGVRVRDVATGRTRPLRAWRPNQFTAGVVWSPAGDRLVVDRGDTLDLTDRAGGWAPSLPTGTDETTGVAWSPDGTRVAWATTPGGSGDPDTPRVLYVADPRTPEVPPHVLVGPQRRGIYDLAFSPDGSRLAFTTAPF